MRKFTNSLCISAIISVITLVLIVFFLELLYGTQWVDFYGKELRSFNASTTLESNVSTTTVLALGDSFTAGNSSYVSQLRTIFPHTRFINGGISGSGVREALLIAKRRFAAFRPKIFLYQIYVGNDLIDLGYHTDWTRYSVSRNIWWSISGIFPSIPYVRRRFQEFQVSRKIKKEELATNGDAVGIDTSPTFSPEHYNERVRQYYILDPSVTDDSIRLQGIRKKDFKEFTSLLERLVAFCTPPNCQPIVWVVPHKSQVSQRYYEQEKMLGAILPDPSIYVKENYPFFQGIQEAMQTQKIPVLNPLGMLRQVEKQHPTYFANDDHLNAFGQKSIAQWLAQQLKAFVH